MSTREAFSSLKEDVLDSIVSNTDDAIISKDLSGTILFWNAAAERMFGFSAQEALGKHIHLIVPEDRRLEVASIVRRIEAGERVHHFETVRQTRAGVRLDVSLSVSPLLRGGRVVGASAIARDVTLQNEARHALERRTQELELANRELDSFSYSVSHDLRAPLRAIDGFAQILLEDHGEALDDEGKRVVGTIRRNVGKMGHLIDDLLTFSHVARRMPDAAPVDMNELVAEVVQELREGGRSDVEVRVADLPRASGDHHLVRQVWVNLVSNALKFTAPRAPAQIEVSGSQLGDEVAYSVSDNGVGFDMAYAHKLFQVFQRLHSAAEFAGTGVGLALVQRIVTRSGGRVWAEGRLDEGATFHFTLPAPAGSTPG